MKRAFSLAALVLLTSASAAFAAAPDSVVKAAASCCELLAACCNGGPCCGSADGGRPRESAGVCLRGRFPPHDPSGWGVRQDGGRAAVQRSPRGGRAAPEAYGARGVTVKGRIGFAPATSDRPTSRWTASPFASRPI